MTPEEPVYGVTGRQWTLEIPAGTPLLTSNQRLHHMAEYQIIQNLQEIVGWLARQQRIPKLERVHITYIVRVTDQRRRDPGNWAPTAKALVDGLVKAGVLSDDSWKQVTGPDPRLGWARQKKMSVALVIREVA